MTGIMGLAGKIPVFMAAVLMACTVANAQTDRREVRRGNRDFRKENFSEAEIDYRRALVKDSTSFAASYNLGNTLYRNGDMEQARKSYETLKDAAAVSQYGADYYYNLGNAAAAMEDWQAAVDAYAQSLLRNPGDMDAKENYVYARGKLKDQQNGGGQNDQDQNNDQNDQDQDKNDQDQDNQNNDSQDRNNDGNQNQDQDQDQNQNGQNNDDRNGSGQGEQPKITPQAAQQMLKAIQAKEKETQEKVNKEKAAIMKSRQKEKNW